MSNHKGVTDLNDELRIQVVFSFPDEIIGLFHLSHLKPKIPSLRCQHALYIQSGNDL